MAYGESVRALELLRRLDLMHYLDGRLLDLGCGPEPVLARAIGVNRGGKPPIYDLDVDFLSTDLAREFGQAGFDCVFSSHCLEHMFSPIGHTLAHWLNLVKPGGYLVLYLPDERYYRFDPKDPNRRNPEHFHYLTMDTFEWHLEQLGGAKIWHLTPDVDVRNGRYSFLAVIRK